ncbi:hypothetical protein [Thermococcus sp.]
MSREEYKKIIRKAEKSLLAAKKILKEDLPKSAVLQTCHGMFYCVNGPLEFRRRYLSSKDFLEG